MHLVNYNYYFKNLYLIFHYAVVINKNYKIICKNFSFSILIYFRNIGIKFSKLNFFFSFKILLKINYLNTDFNFICLKKNIIKILQISYQNFRTLFKNIIIYNKLKKYLDF